MDSSILRAARIGVAALVLACAGAVLAQEYPAQSVYPVETDPGKATVKQQEQQQVQPGNNQPLWGEVRSGAPQTTSLPGRETNVLIQPGGQTWRALRNSQLAFWGGWGIALVFLAIVAFYFWRGPIGLHEPPTGRVIRRFAPWERLVHQTTAITFSILAISGLVILFGKNILLPLIGYTLFSWLAILSKNLHNFIGPLFIVCIVLLFAAFVRNNIWRAYDFAWLRTLGGMFGGREVPSHRFNAGEKLWFWGGVTVLGLITAASGLVLDFPNFDQTRQTMQIANVVHLVATTLFMMGAMGHIYLGTVGMVGAYDAMRTGYVDETWAKEHHELWYRDIKEGRIVQKPEGETVPMRERAA